MTTIAHRLSTVMPRPFAAWVRPKWHFWRDLLLFHTRCRGRLARDRDLRCWIASRPFAGRRLEVAVRSYRELRRYLQFNQDEADIVRVWLEQISDCEVLYDVGSANGLEGFFVHHRHGAKIVFVEPYTPSIETILKTIAHQTKSGTAASDFEVVHAGCDSTVGYGRYLMHSWPKPGETGNTVSDPEAYCRGGRGHLPVVLSQWLSSVSLDSLHHQFGLPLPTHVKMDIDGFELRALEGATQLLASRHVRTWAIEVNGHDQRAHINRLMEEQGYVDIASSEHYPGYEHYTGDHIYVRDDLVETWRPHFATWSTA